jgi:hypothetical protein
MSSTSDTAGLPKLTRYQLPGFGLPLNFTPGSDKDSKSDFDRVTKAKKESLPPGTLYPTALDGQRAK